MPSKGKFFTSCAIIVRILLFSVVKSHAVHSAPGRKCPWTGSTYRAVVSVIVVLVPVVVVVVDVVAVDEVTVVVVVVVVVSVAVVVVVVDEVTVEDVTEVVVVVVGVVVVSVMLLVVVVVVMHSLTNPGQHFALNTFHHSRSVVSRSLISNPDWTQFSSHRQKPAATVVARMSIILIKFPWSQLPHKLR